MRFDILTFCLLIQEEQLKLIGKNIRQLRRANGMTGADLGLLTGIGRTGISKIEKGKINVTIHTLLTICTHLKVELSTLIN